MKSFLLFLSFFCCYSLYASMDSSYTLVYKSGSAYFYTQETKSWKPISITDSISHRSRVRLGKTSYLLLKSPQGLIEFNQTGIYKLREYNSKLVQPNEFALKWQNIALDTIAKSKKLNRPFNKTEIEMQTLDGGLAIYPPATIIADSNIILKWKGDPKKIYEIRFFQSERSIFLIRSLTGSELHVNLFDLHLPFDRCIYYTVEERNSTSFSSLKPRCLYFLNIMEYSNIHTDEYRIAESFKSDKSSIQHLCFALFFESQKVMHLAEKHYKEAYFQSQLSPRYKQFYYLFLERKNTIKID